MPDEKTEKIRQLNDAFRTSLQTDDRHKLAITQGIRDEPDEYVFALLDLVRAFDDFNDGNDPHKEHDFGEINYKGNKIFWEFDYYGNSLAVGSEDASDPDQTIRVLTIMLASEY